MVERETAKDLAVICPTAQGEIADAREGLFIPESGHPAGRRGGTGGVTGFLSVRDREEGFHAGRETLRAALTYNYHTTMRADSRSKLERNMGEVIQFVSKSERERIRLIKEARARYESVFPSADVVNDPRHGRIDGFGAVTDCD